MDLVNQFISTLGTTFYDVLPIVTIFLGFQFIVIRKPLAHPLKLAIGFGYVLLGLTLFLMGLEKALFPLGELMATQLTSPEFIYDKVSYEEIHWADFYWVYLFAFAIGFSTTIAEPSLMAVAIKAQEVSGGAINPWGLRISVALGVAIGISLGSYRIIVGDPIHYYIAIGYVFVIIQTFRAPKLIVPLAYDSGGVTTSTVTVPLVAALGLGLASTIPGRSPLIDGFGLIAFASLFPMITVMGYAQLSQWYADKQTQKESN
jgi:hypothetical protein